MAERQCLSAPAAPMDHEHRDRLSGRAAVVDRQTPGAVRCLEARDPKAPVVSVEAARGPNIDATLVQDSDREIAKHDLAFCGPSHCCPPKTNRIARSLSPRVRHRVNSFAMSAASRV